jgi:hypothetical protein
MNEYELPWLLGSRLATVEAHEFDRWTFAFSQGGTIAIGCPWRLLHNCCIAVSSADHGQQFGLPARVNAATLLIETVGINPVTAVFIAEGTADLSISFGSEQQLQVLVLSSGYEAWESFSPTGFHLIAQAQGQLVGFKP